MPVNHLVRPEGKVHTVGRHQAKSFPWVAGKVESSARVIARRTDSGKRAGT